MSTLRSATHRKSIMMSKYSFTPGGAHRRTPPWTNSSSLPFVRRQFLQWHMRTLTAGVADCCRPLSQEDYDAPKQSWCVTRKAKHYVLLAINHIQCKSRPDRNECQRYLDKSSSRLQGIRIEKYLNSDTSLTLGLWLADYIVSGSYNLLEYNWTHLQICGYFPPDRPGHCISPEGRRTSTQ